MSKARKKIQSSRGVLKFNCNTEFGSESDTNVAKKRMMSVDILIQESVPHFNKGTPHLPLPEKKIAWSSSGRGRGRAGDAENSKRALDAAGESISSGIGFIGTAAEIQIVCQCLKGLTAFLNAFRTKS